MPERHGCCMTGRFLRRLFVMIYGILDTSEISSLVLLKSGQPACRRRGRRSPLEDQDHHDARHKRRYSNRCLPIPLAVYRSSPPAPSTALETSRTKRPGSSSPDDFEAPPSSCGSRAPSNGQLLSGVDKREARPYAILPNVAECLSGAVLRIDTIIDVGCSWSHHYGGSEVRVR